MLVQVTHVYQISTCDLHKYKGNSTVLVNGSIPTKESISKMHNCYTSNNK
jgi:peptide subunit release factor 1 (eRF1)